MNNIHVLPIDDLKEHKDTGTDCECSPIIVHNSFDRREDKEKVCCDIAEVEGQWNCVIQDRKILPNIYGVIKVSSKEDADKLKEIFSNL